MNAPTAASSVVGIIGGLSLAVNEAMTTFSTATNAAITETSTTTLAITFSGISLAAVLAWKFSQAWAKLNSSIDILQRQVSVLQNDVSKIFHNRRRDR